MSEQSAQQDVQFICDAMLGGLARWLRAAGYSAEFDVHLADGALVRRALSASKVLLTSDSGIMERYAVSRGLVRAVFIPRGKSVIAQLAHVLRELNLPLGDSRCMDCDGELREVQFEEVAGRVPEKVKECCDNFFVCRSCGNVLWRGTHWASITRRLAMAQELARSGRAKG